MSGQIETNHEEDSGTDSYDVLVIGGGVSGLSAGVFTARAGLDTLIVNHEGSILRRNAQLENYLGFPAGVNSRLFLDMAEEQARRAGCEFHEGQMERLEHVNGGFESHLENDELLTAERVIAASWSDSSYLEALDIDLEQRGSKQFVLGGGDGRTSVEGLYAAGRLADQYHQTIVSAGHGAQVAITLIHDSDTPFYHDWVAPEGYFTDRGRDVPPGIEEITKNERQRRERKSIETMRQYFDEPRVDSPVPHPSLADDD